MGKAKDITNQKFGLLTALECVGKPEGKSTYHWKCKCDCGKEVIVNGSSLRSGNTKSCGCMKYSGLQDYNLKQSEKNKIKIGTRFGKLTVIEDIGFKMQVEGHNRRWYKCQCDCGNIKEVMGNLLKQGQVSSCGKCQMNSCGEYQIKQLLENNNINYQYDMVFPELLQETGRRLRFDFIIYDSTFTIPLRFIEFDGRQHITGPENPAWINSDPIEKIQERDNIKNSFCLSHNYPLVRLPYTLLNKITIEDILNNKYLVKGDDEQ